VTGSEHPRYGDKGFWDERYSASAAAATSAAAAAAEMSGDGTQGTYEWYVSYERLRPPLLADLLQQQTTRSGGGCRVLVAGCGNSTLCEDLHAEGENII